MRCDEIEVMLAAFVDGELKPAEKKAVTEHVESCLACQAELAATKATRERVASLPRVPAPAALAGAIAGAIAGAGGSRLGAPVVAPTAHLEERLSAFLDGELPERERAAAGEHLTQCPECSRGLAAIDEVAGRVRGLPRASAPPTFAASVIERIFAPRRTRTAAAPIQLPPTVRRFLAAASILVLAIGSAAFTTPNVSSAPHPGIPEVHLALAPPPPPSAPPEEPPGNGRASLDRTVHAVADDPAVAATALGQLASVAGFTFAAADKDGYDVTGPPEAVRQVAGVVTLEDQAAFDALVPPALDRVTTQSGECFTGTVTEEPARLVVTAAARATDLANPDAFGPGDGLLAEYFALDRTPDDLATAFGSVEGKAALLRTTEPTVDVTTPGALAGARAFSIARQENVAIRFTGYLAARKTGSYFFSLGSDDGARLEIDHRAVCGYDGNHGYTESQASWFLLRGLHPITVLYFNGGGPGSCRLSFSEPGAGSFAVVPQQLLHDAERIERGRSVLSVAIPRRSVVKLERASTDPVTIRLQVSRRGD